MRHRNLVIIDDEPDDDGINTMCEDLRKEGVEVNCIVFNPKDKQYEDISVFYKDLKKHLRDKHIHLIACDYTLGANLDATDVLHKIKHEWHFHNTTNILFSTKIESILNEIFDSGINFSEKILKLKKLVRSNSIDFPSRIEIFNTIKGQLRGDRLQEIDIKHELLQWLYAFENHQFMGHPSLERKTLKQIAEAIEDDTSLGVEFQKLFVEQGISTMIQLNNLPDNA